MTAVKTQLGAKDDAWETPFQPTDDIVETDQQRAIGAAYTNAVAAAIAGAAPIGADYIVGAANASLTAERVATDTTTVNVDVGTPGQAAWHVLEVPGIDAAGMVARTGSANYEARAIIAPAAGVSVSNGDGVAGNPTLELANDLAALEALASTGLAARTAADTWAQRTITAPAAGITITDGSGVAGNPTLALADDLAALESLASTGLAARTAANSWAQRTVTGTANEIAVANGDGVAGNPTLSLPSALTLTGKTVTGGTFSGPALSGTIALASGAVLSWDAGDVTITHAGNTITFAGGSSGYAFTGGPVVPATNDAAALGTTALGWSDAFFAAGGTIHFANTDWVATHSTGVLTIGTGDLRITTAGINSASVATVGGTQTLSGKSIALSANTLSGTTSEFNTALSDGNFATLAGSEALTNKTLTNPDLSTSYLQASEIATPSNPAANALRVYAKDVGGVTRLHTLDSAGTETELGAGGSVDPDSLFNSVTVGTADSGNVLEVYALSDEGNYDGILHTLSDDYNRLIRISRVSSSDGVHVPMDVALASRGTLDSPSPMQAGDRSWAIAAAGRAADNTWQRLGYQWFEVKSAPSSNIIPGMYVLRVTKPDDYFPRTIISADWTDGIRQSAHAGFDGIIDQTDAATIAWDVTEAQVAEVTLGGNRTLLPSGMTDGFEYNFFPGADGSARILSFSSSGGLVWLLRGSDGILYTESSPLALPASGLAHIKMTYGGGAFIGTVTLISGHPERAVAPSVQFTSLTANRAGSNVNTAQAVFETTEDTLTVEGSTSYFFESVYSFTRSAGTTAHRTNVLFGGTATFTSIGYHVIASSTEADFGGGLPYAFGRHANVATAFDIFGADTNDAAETVTVKLSGIMRINAAGTVVPQIQYSAAPGGAPTFLAGSYFRAWPIGSNTVAAVGDFA